MRSLNAGGVNCVWCQGKPAALRSTELQDGKAGWNVRSRARGSRLKSDKPVPSTWNRYGSPSFKPGTKLAQCPPPIGAIREVVSCFQPLKSPDTWTAWARGAQTRNVAPPGTSVPPTGAWRNSDG